MKVVFKVNGQEYTVDLPEQTLKDLKEIAERNGLDLIAALQQAIVNEKFLEDQQADGAELLIKKGNTVRELVRS